jgi:hypothetical protein
MRTRLRAQAFPTEDASGLALPETRTDAFVELASPDCARNGEIVTP